MSLFDLPTSASELKSANAGISRKEYRQIPPDRNATGANFSAGVIRFPFGVDGQSYWVPAQSYFRIRMNITKADGEPLNVSDQLGLNMNPASCLWQSGEIRMNNQTVSRCSDYFAQIDMLEKRLDKSRAWIEYTGNSTEVLDYDLKRRLNVTASDGAEGSSAPQEQLSLDFEDDMGFAAANQVAWTQATGTLTFTANGARAIPDLRTFINSGDVVTCELGGLAGKGLIVTAVNAATLIVTGTALPADIAAANIGANAVALLRNAQRDREVEFIELNYQPLALSLFKCNKAIPAAQISVELTPSQESVWKKRVIESLLGQGDKAAGTDYQVNIEQIYMYAATCEGPRVDDKTYLLDLESTRCMADAITSANLSQNTFNLSPSCHAFTVAYQDNRAGVNSSVSATKLKSYNNAADESVDENLERWYAQTKGQRFPQVDYDAELSEGKDYFNQLYMNSILACGAYHDAGGAETFKEWIERGPYLHWKVPTDGSNVDTRFAVNQSFAAGSQTNQTQVLLFDHYREAVQVVVKDGRTQLVSAFEV